MTSDVFPFQHHLHYQYPSVSIIFLNTAQHDTHFPLKGLKKTLIYHDENLTAKIRGKIDVSKNIKHNTARGRSDKFYCSYVDFTDDNIENRIVKAALLKSKKILKEKFSSEASVNGKINFCLNSLRHVKVTNISNTDIITLAPC